MSRNCYSLHPSTKTRLKAYRYLPKVRWGVCCTLSSRYFRAIFQITLAINASPSTAVGEAQGPSESATIDPNSPHRPLELRPINLALHPERKCSKGSNIAINANQRQHHMISANTPPPQPYPRKYPAGRPPRRPPVPLCPEVFLAATGHHTLVLMVA